MNRLAAMEAFVRVVEAGSFSAAARQLHMGQPALSKTVAQLEGRLGVQLLLRSTQGLTATEAGQNFYERAKRAIEEADEAEIAARGANASLSGELRISAAVTFARLHVVPRLAAFLAEHPALEMNVVLDDRNIDIIEAGVHVALRMGSLEDSALISGRRDDAGQALAAELRALGAEAEYVHADVRLEADVSRLVDQVVGRFRRLDIAVNNAGTEGQSGPLTDQSIANFEATFATNVLGTLLSLKHEMRVMLKQRAGSIVNLSSMGGKVGIAGASVYVASKHAVEGLTKSAALEGAVAGVRVNAVAPGPVATEMLERFTGGDEEVKAGFVSTIPAKRTATPEEIAQTILFLAGDKSRYLTGQSISVDGGYTAQ